MNIPNLFIVGAPKAGTTSVYNYLNQHPEIFMSEMKEPNFFSQVPELGPTIVIRNEQDYLKLFKKGSYAKILGEASTTYLYFEGTEKRIFDFNPQAYIMIFLRNPVERAYSHYLMDRDKFLIEKDPPEKAMKDLNDPRKYGFHGLNKNPYIYPSIYYEHIKRYLDIFGEKKVKIIIFEKFKTDIIQNMKQIFTFLGVDSEFEIQDTSIKNYYKSPKFKLLIKIAKNKYTFKLKKYIPENIRQFLNNSLFYSNTAKPELDPGLKLFLYEKYFMKDIENLSELLKMDLNEIWKI